MKNAKRFFSILVATAVVTGCIGIPLLAEETVTDESVAIETSEQETVPAEMSSGKVTSEPATASTEESAASETTSQESHQKEIIENEELTPLPLCIESKENQTSGITENTSHEVSSMLDLIVALGEDNVTVISSTELRLDRSIDWTNQAVIEFISLNEGTYKIDFNGYQITSYGDLEVRGGNVTLLDSSTAKTGGWTAVYIDNKFCANQAILQIAGTLTVLSGRYTSHHCGIRATSGTLRIEGGEFIGNVDPEGNNGPGVHATFIESLTITGGVFKGPGSGLYLVFKDAVDKVSIFGGSFWDTGNVSTSGGIKMFCYTPVTTLKLSDILADGAIALPSTSSTLNESTESYDYEILYTGKSVEIVPTIGTEGFVYRMYTTALGRYPDSKGFFDWVARLKNMDITGADAGFAFFFSTEMNDRKLSDKDFITVLYNVFLGRAPDETGMANWLCALSSGMSRQYVFSGFANSTEWKNLCARYGITAGSWVSTEARDQNVKITAFVSRLYSGCLNRPADVPGLNCWTEILNKKTQDGAHVALGFFFSNEMINRNISNEAYVEVLYNVLLGRSADATGKASWVAQLGAGKTRLEIFKGFVHSAEFTAICESYGITRGSI